MVDENYEPGAGWKVQEVEVVGANGPHKVPGMVHPSAPGVAVTMPFFGWFTATHLGTGKAFPGRYQRACTAAVVAAQWARVFDCTVADPKKLMEQANDEPVPFDCKLTGGGESRQMTRTEWVRMVGMDWSAWDEFPWEETDPWETADKIMGLAPEPEEAT